MSYKFYILKPGNKLQKYRKFESMCEARGGQNPHKNQKIGISKMQPKIVVMLVLETPKHLELGLKLQN